MKLDFKQLNEDAIPKVKDLSNVIWNGEDYVGNVIKKWMMNPTCFVYGVNHKGKLLGFGNLWMVTPTFAWLQGIRVHPEYRKQGIGFKLFKFGLESAENAGAKTIQFSTSSRNNATRIIGIELGFSQKTEMEAFYLQNYDKVPKTFSIENLKKLDLQNAFKALKGIPYGPIDEICYGWSYFPPDLDILKQNKGKWFKYQNSVLLELCDKEDVEGESPMNEIWYILYGKESDALKLLVNRLNVNQGKEFNYISLFCSTNLRKMSFSLGFSYDGGAESRKVILFEKKI